MLLNNYYLKTGALECPRCGNKSQHILVDESNPGHIKAVCHNCRQYIKFLSKKEQGSLTPPLGTYRSTEAPTTNINVDVGVTTGHTADIYSNPRVQSDSLGVSEARLTRESLEELLASGFLSERWENVLKDAIAIIREYEN